MAMATSKSSKLTKRNGQPGDRAFSSIVVDGPERAASRAMLHAVGFKAEDFKKSQIGVASTWSMVTPCNMHIDQLAVHVAQGVNEAGGKAVVFGTITISDGISMCTANTMASAIEALGMSLPNSSAQAAVSPDKTKDCQRAGEAVLNLIKLGI